ncbi:acetyl-CoA synthetase-like protein [Acephala macrosclerotiorum]|nr:acetyl-CoA synthetase-like protein [Acephala macrosclerotiorum]
MLAILRAGGAFVPLDPSHPPSPRRIIKKTKAIIGLTSSMTVRLFGGVSLSTVIVSQTVLSPAPPLSIISLYMLNHKSRVLHYSAYTFDASMMDIFTTLIFVTWALLTPSVANLIVPDEIPSLITLALGGEAVTQGNAQCWAEKFELLNCYGSASTDLKAAVIGRAFDPFFSLVIDPVDHNNLELIGAVGELVVEGPVVPRGYLHKMMKTKASFIPNPTSHQRLHDQGAITGLDSNCLLDWSHRLPGISDLVPVVPRPAAITKSAISENHPLGPLLPTLEKEKEIIGVEIPPDTKVTIESPSTRREWKPRFKECRISAISFPPTPQEKQVRSGGIRTVVESIRSRRIANGQEAVS